MLTDLYDVFNQVVDCWSRNEIAFVQDEEMGPGHSEPLEEGCIPTTQRNSSVVNFDDTVDFC